MKLIEDDECYFPAAGKRPELELVFTGAVVIHQSMMNYLPNFSDD